MLLRARDRKLRRGSGLSTATRRWRPAEALGRRGARARGQQGRGIGPRKEGGDVWRSSQQEVAPSAVAERRQGRSTVGGRRAEQGPTCARKKKRGERSGGLVCDFQKM
jgi:hypothetical protein